MEKPIKNSSTSQYFFLKLFNNLKCTDKNRAKMPESVLSLTFSTLLTI